MVLDDNTTTPSDFNSDFTPVSDSDPYSTTTSSDKFIPKNLPSPPPILGPLFGFTDAYCTSVINTRIQGAAQILRRPPTPNEATALAYWSAKMLSYAAWGRPLGMAAGCYQAYRTAATYRFPFLQPKPERFHPDVFKLLKFELRGSQARSMWHSLRAIAYGTFGLWIGGLLVGTYAATVAAVGERQDPRLQNLIRAIQERVRRETLPAAPADAPSKQRQGTRGDPTGQGTRSATRTSNTYGDDASPSSGDAYDAYNSSTTAEQDRTLAMSEGSVLTDQQMQKQEARQRPNRRSSPTKTTASTFSMEKVERQPRSFNDDDASPMGGEGSFMDSGYDSDSSSAATGSAWERIRQQASSSSSSRAAGRGRSRGSRRGVQTQEDSFTFSATEQERQLAKDEAQRAFDERIERERKGGEF